MQTGRRLVHVYRRVPAKLTTRETLAAALIALLALPAPSLAATPKTVVTPSPVATCSDGSPAGNTITFQDVFAHTIDDTATLRFIAELVAMDEAHQRTVLANLRKSDDVAPVAADFDAGCLTESSYRIARALALVAEYWTVDTRDERFDRLTHRIEKALAAPTDDATLAPFGIHARDLADPAPVTTCDVPDHDARTIHAKQPTYPAIARTTRTTGLVKVRVAVDPFGLVRSVSLIESTAGVGPGPQALVESSIASAAASTFDPRLVSCKGLAGAYIFKADYLGR